MDPVQATSTWVRRDVAAFVHGAYSMRHAPILHGRPARDAAIMGRRKPRLGVEIRMGDPQDPLRLYASHYQLIACCRRPFCEHRRELHTELLIRLFGADALLGSIATRFRCHRCGMRGARIEARFIGS